MIILDTDILIKILEKKKHLHDKILKKIREFSLEEIVTTSLNLEEFLYGAIKRNIKLEPNHPLLQMVILPFTKENAILAANLEVELEQKGLKKPRGDIIIASIALHHNASLFTLNIKHFKVIPNLKLLLIE